jgi:hypothetical protein
MDIGCPHSNGFLDPIVETLPRRAAILRIGGSGPLVGLVLGRLNDQIPGVRSSGSPTK